jgi:hypothetical protein
MHYSKEILNSSAYRAGWNYGLDYPAGKLTDAVKLADRYPEPGVFLYGRNEAVKAWHENEREIAAWIDAGIDAEAERCRA